MLTKKPVFSRFQIAIAGVLVLTVAACGFTNAQEKAGSEKISKSVTVSERVETTIEMPGPLTEGQKANDEKVPPALAESLGVSSNKSGHYAAKVNVIQGSASDVQNLLTQSDDEQLNAMLAANNGTGIATIESDVATAILDRVKDSGCNLCCSPTLVALDGREAELMAKNMDFPIDNWIESSGEWKLSNDEPDATQELLVTLRPDSPDNARTGQMTWQVSLQVRQFLTRTTNEIIDRADPARKLSLPGNSVRRLNTVFFQESGKCHVYLIPGAVAKGPATALPVEQAFRVLAGGTPVPVPPIPGQPVSVVERNPQDSISFGATLVIIQTGAADETSDK